MKLWGTRLFQTVVGKTIIGVVVVTVGVGAAAAGGADVPLLTSASADEVVEPDDDEDSDDEDSDDESSDDDFAEQAGRDGGDGDEGDDPQDDGDDADDDDADGDDADGDDADGDDADGDDADGDGAGASASVDTDDEPNHGEVVSTFTQSTELTGCEKGQATAAVARGDVDPAADGLDEALAPYLERCTRDGADEADPDEIDPDGEVADWKQTRDEGRTIRDEARQAFVDACGDDDGDDDEAEDAGDDGELSSECIELHAAAKQAHEDWKAAWHAERDAAKGSHGPVEVADPQAASASADAPGPPDHAKANGKQQANQSSSNDKGNGKSKGNGQSKGNGKP